jgi:hypothetical protein
MTKIKYNKYYRFEIIGVILLIALISCGNKISDKANIDKNSNIENGQNYKQTEF